MYEVVIFTVSSGRVQRVRFSDAEAAWACADKWNAKNATSQTYRVTVQTVLASRVGAAVAPAKPGTGRGFSM